MTTREETERRILQRCHSKGSLSPDTSYELIVVGPMGARELKMLIRKLQLDLEIMGAADD